MRKLPERLHAWVGRHRIMVSTIATVLAIIFLPLLPFTPECRNEQGHWGRLGAFVLAPAYRSEVTYLLSEFDVPYFAIAGMVFIPSWVWLTGGTDDELANVSVKAFHAQLETGWTDRPDLPGHIKTLMAKSRATHDGRLEEACKLVRAVAIEGW